MADVGFDYWVQVPCSVVSRLTLPNFGGSIVVAAREEEALAIACGLRIVGSSTMVSMQSSGLANSLNTLGSLALSYGLGFVTLVAVRGLVGEHNPTQVPVGCAIESALEAFGFSFKWSTVSAALEDILWASYLTATASNTPSFVLLGQDVGDESGS